MAMTLQFSNMTSSSELFDVVLFLLSDLVTCPSFMPISWLVLELWHLIRDWPEIWKSEIPLSEFCPISGDWGKLGILDLVRKSLIKYIWIVENARVTAFTVSVLLRETQHGGGGKINSTTQISVKRPLISMHRHSCTQYRYIVFALINTFSFHGWAKEKIKENELHMEGEKCWRWWKKDWVSWLGWFQKWDGLQ